MSLQVDKGDVPYNRGFQFGKCKYTLGMTNFIDLGSIEV